jgi:hypothetical protein
MGKCSIFSQNVWESVPFLAKTYGKVFHFWQFDKGDTLPISPPQLMMAITADGRLRLAASECIPRAPHPLIDLLLLLNS